MRFHGAEAGGGTGWGPEALVFCGRVVGLAAGVQEGDIGGAEGQWGLTAYHFHEVASAVCNHAKARS